MMAHVEASVNVSNITRLQADTLTCPENITSLTGYQGLAWATKSLKQFYIWFVFAFGFPGNIFSIIVVIKLSRQRKATSLFFVGLLAFVDNITIILKLIENQSQNERFHMNDSACKLLFFLGLTFANYANWILITLVVERYIAVRYPLRVAVVWSLRKASFIICAVFLFMCIVHVHLLWTVTDTPNGYTCTLTLTGFESQAWFYVGSFLYAILPACFLIPGNILIIVRLRRSTTRRHKLTESSPSLGTNLKRQERQITAMLVTVTVVFVVLSFPRCMYIIAHAYWETQPCTLDNLRKGFLNVLSSNIADTNHAVNFYLYFLAGKRFRDAFNCKFRSFESSTHNETM